MSMAPAARPSVVLPKGRSRRPFWWILLVLLVSVSGWMLWGAIRDWADAQALRSYFQELEAREPGWKERVYGRPATEGERKQEEKWAELSQMIGKSNGWAPYRSGLYQGMYHDPDQPFASLPTEQLTYLEAAHEFWLPLMKQWTKLDSPIRSYIYYDRTLPYEKMQSTASAHASTVFLLNEALELEVLFHITKNDPEQAINLLMRCMSPQHGYRYGTPFLVERCLNQTQPQATTLKRLQQFLEERLSLIEKGAFLEYGSMLRRMEHSIAELGNGSLTNVQIDRMASQYGMLTLDSIWTSSFLGWFRPYYLRSRLSNLFRRSHHLILKQHQLADHVEGLARVDPTVRWDTWKNFAAQHSILLDIKSFGKARPNIPYTEAIPEALYMMYARYLHLGIIYYLENQAELGAALSAVIAERFRLDQGRFPQSWNELVPENIAQPVLDPFTGKPLLMKVKDNHIVIYSAGSEGKDDGGERLRDQQRWQTGRTQEAGRTNLGVRVYLPALRRGPAFVLEDVERAALVEYTQKLQSELKKGKE